MPDSSDASRSRRRTATANFVITPRASRARVHPAQQPGEQISLMMAVPKRLLKRAVDRNAVRRVAREAWRASAAAVSGAMPPVLLRLTSKPANLAGMSRVQRKRFWRVELDQLMARFLNV